MVERATAEYVSKLRAVLGNKASVNIQIEGVPLSKIGTIAEFLYDEEGQRAKIKSRNSIIRGNVNYIYHTLKGEGFSIEEISE